MDRGIYLDNASTTFPKPECVYRAMEETGRTCGVNAGRGSYALARKASKIIEDAREWIKKLSGADEVAEVVFTASATVACNQIFGGLDWKETDVVYVSPFEHNAVMRVLHLWQKRCGFSIEELALDKERMELDLEKIRYQFLRKRPDVVAVSQVSNVTGYLLPIEELAGLAGEYGAVVVVDGAQGFGLAPICFSGMAVDFYLFAGHKTLYGPMGTGGFIQSGRTKLKPFLAGGTGSHSLDLEMPDDAALEPGSPNVTALAGLLAAVKELCAEADGPLWQSSRAVLKREQTQMETLVQKLQEISGVRLYLPKTVSRRAGIVAFNIEGYQAADVGMILDEDYGIAVRTGYHCAPLIHKYLEDEEFHGVVRVSLGRFTKDEELERLVRAVMEIAEG